MSRIEERLITSSDVSNLERRLEVLEGQAADNQFDLVRKSYEKNDNVPDNCIIFTVYYCFQIQTRDNCQSLLIHFSSFQFLAMSREIRFVDNLLNNLSFISPAKCHYSRMRNFSRGLCGTRRRERRPVHYRLQHPKCSSRGKPNYRDTRNRFPRSQRGVDQHMCHTNQSEDNSACPSTTRR